MTIWPRYDETYAYLENLWSFCGFPNDLELSWHARKLLISYYEIRVFNAWFQIFYATFNPVKDVDKKNYVVRWYLGWDIWTLQLLDQVILSLHFSRGAEMFCKQFDFEFGFGLRTQIGIWLFSQELLDFP